VKYHEDFEKSKGKLTQIADDPETVRIRNASKIISNVAYHGELEKKKQMEEKRTLLPEDAVKNGFEGQTTPRQIPIHPPTAVIMGK
jgi:LIM and SH3 domain protein 1